LLILPGENKALALPTNSIDHRRRFLFENLPGFRIPSGCDLEFDNLAVECNLNLLYVADAAHPLASP
jgi:hypothetical protein